MKKYKLVYDKSKPMLGLYDYTRYMLYKKFLFWYSPLMVKEFKSSPYARALDKTVKYMESTKIEYMVHFFKRGKFYLESFTNERPMWLFMAQDKNNNWSTLKEEYYDDLNDFIESKAEYLV